MNNKEDNKGKKKSPLISVFKKIDEAITKIKPFVRQHKALSMVIIFSAGVSVIGIATHLPSIPFPSFRKHVSEIEVIPITAFRCAAAPFVDTLTLSGPIKGSPDIECKFEVPGTIDKYYFKEGDIVKAGDLIVSLRNDEQSSRLKIAEIEYADAKRLLEIGAITESKFKQMEAEYQVAKASYNRTVVIAPTDGITGKRAYDEGSYVPQGEKVTSFAGIDDMVVDVSIVEEDMAKLKPGLKAEVVADLYPDKVFEGSVDSVSKLYEDRTKTANCKIKIRNIGKALLPGMSGRCKITIYEKNDAFSIPKEALQMDAKGGFVYVIENPPPEDALPKGIFKFLHIFPKKKVSKDDAAQIASKRYVEIDYVSSGAVVIKSGVQAGDLVALADTPGLLSDRSQVRVLEIKEPSKKE